MKKSINSLFIVSLLTSCQSLPQLFSAAEQIADDNAVKVEIQKEAMNPNTNLNITVDVTNAK